MRFGGIQSHFKLVKVAFFDLGKIALPLLFLMMTTFLYFNATRITRKEIARSLAPTFQENTSYLSNTSHIAKAKLSISEVIFEGSNFKDRVQSAISDYEDKKGRGLANANDLRLQHQKLTGVTNDLLSHMQHHPQFEGFQSDLKKSLMGKYKNDQVVKTIYRPAAIAGLLWGVYSGEKIEARLTDQISIYSRTQIDQGSSEFKSQEFGFSSSLLSGGFEIAPLLGDGDLNDRYRANISANVPWVDTSIALSHGFQTQRTALSITKKLHRNVACTYEIDPNEQKTTVQFGKAF